MPGGSRPEPGGDPNQVPVCYLYDAGCFYIALDEKPKSVEVRRLKRAEHRKSASLGRVDRYSDD
ncbi:MAG: hypothetical protein WKH64_14860 [Chloroflexia bacterium]